MQHFILNFGHSHDNSWPSSLLQEQEHEGTQRQSPSSCIFLSVQVIGKSREVRVLQTRVFIAMWEQSFLSSNLYLLDHNVQSGFSPGCIERLKCVVKRHKKQKASKITKFILLLNHFEIFRLCNMSVTVWELFIVCRSTFVPIFLIKGFSIFYWNLSQEETVMLRWHTFLRYKAATYCMKSNGKYNRLKL